MRLQSHSLWLLALALASQMGASQPVARPWCCRTDRHGASRVRHSLPRRAFERSRLQPSSATVCLDQSGGALALYTKVPRLKSISPFAPAATASIGSPSARTTVRAKHGRKRSRRRACEFWSIPRRRKLIGGQPHFVERKSGQSPAAFRQTGGTTSARAYAESNEAVTVAGKPASTEVFGAERVGPAAAPTMPGLPPGERPRMINSRTFDLEYEVDSIGPSGIGRVELWGTRDGGQTWRRFTVVATSAAPCGRTSARKAFTASASWSPTARVLGQTAAAGDQPDLWIGVELTKPTARIVLAQQGVESEAGQLIISWQADDKMLAARPVSLSFSQARGGRGCRSPPAWRTQAVTPGRSTPARRRSSTCGWKWRRGGQRGRSRNDGAGRHRPIASQPFASDRFDR